MARGIQWGLFEPNDPRAQRGAFDRNHKTMLICNTLLPPRRRKKLENSSQFSLVYGCTLQVVTKLTFNHNFKKYRDISIDDYYMSTREESM